VDVDDPGFSASDIRHMGGNGGLDILIADLAQLVVTNGSINGSLASGEQGSQGTSPAKQTPSRSQTRTGDGRSFQKITAVDPPLTHVFPL
jgi:hypothetical protein